MKIELLASNAVRAHTATLYYTTVEKIGLQSTTNLFYLLKVLNILQQHINTICLSVRECKLKDIA